MDGTSPRPLTALSPARLPRANMSTAWWTSQATPRCPWSAGTAVPLASRRDAPMRWPATTTLQRDSTTAVVCCLTALASLATTALSSRVTRTVTAFVMPTKWRVARIKPLATTLPTRQTPTTRCARTRPTRMWTVTAIVWPMPMPMAFVTPLRWPVARIPTRAITPPLQQTTMAAATSAAGRPPATSRSMASNKRLWPLTESPGCAPTAFTSPPRTPATLCPR